MDTAIGTGGDLERDSRGRPVLIDGKDELMQRAYILLAAKKGSFVYDRELGSDIYSVSPSDAGAAGTIEEMARDALGAIPGMEVNGVMINEGEVRIFAALEGEESEVCLPERSGA